MSNQLLRASGNILRLPHRVLSTTASHRSQTAELEVDASKTSVIDRVDTSKLKSEWYPKIGNRDVVGYGLSGQANYYDRPDYPYPSIRFKENTPEVMALRLKEKGDWKSLSVEEVKQLYRISFCQTFAEMHAPTGEWKQAWSFFFYGLLMTICLELFISLYIYAPLPKTTNKEWQFSNMDVMIDRKQRAIEGWGIFPTRFWDYDKDEWKK